MPESGSAAERVVETLKTVAHPVRLGILAVLCEGQENVGALAKRLGVRRGAVSNSLAVLRMAQLVAVSRRDGRATYRLNDEGVRGLVAWATRSISAGRQQLRPPASAPEERGDLRRGTDARRRWLEPIVGKSRRSSRSRPAALRRETALRDAPLTSRRISGRDHGGAPVER